jgi:hypothetical protein
MRRLEQKAVTFAAGLVMLWAGSHAVRGQSMPPPHVYNPGIYQSNRTLMSNRAAARAVIKKRHRAKALRRVSPRRRAKVHRHGSPRRSTR